MSWIAARMQGRDGQALGRVEPGGSLRRGSLVAEIVAQRADDVPLIFVRRRGADEVLSLQRVEGGRLALLHRAGGAIVALTVGLGEGPTRLTYSWDCGAGRSLLTAESVESGQIRQQAVRAAAPLSSLAVAALLSPRAVLHPALGWWAIGTDRMPVGPGPCVAPDSLIDTPRGPVEARALRRGDLVQTQDRGVQAVLWSGPVRAPAMGSYRAVRLLAPSFGRDRDLWVHPSRHVLIAGQDVEYLFGDTEILVEARHLVNGATAIWAEPDPGFVWQGLLLAGGGLLRANGTVVTSLDVGGLARVPAVAATTALGLLSATGQLPVHRRPAQRVALPYEAMALTQALVRRLAPVAA